ncbi:hypothetical protein GCM10011360_45290 [Primorskyibacter flagellatus]|uniref:Uncharacterized protein n=1 Tax=Primorskyibacter flagellatus TaxID=1387277 RepID=A0A917EK15_9RHOB|nr:hypothetical protein GCM10011360_45290 [Primorskyibacter flagellatus]
MTKNSPSAIRAVISRTAAVPANRLLTPSSKTDIRHSGTPGTPGIGNGPGMQ